MEENKEKTEESIKEELPYIEMRMVDETVYKTLSTRKHDMRKAYTPENPKMIKSFIPGTILKLFVKEGSKVKKGEKLLSFEAMKMHNEICTTVAGKVKKINIKVGNRMVRNEILIELE
jgi:biotin carboxyl carrier protein